MSNAWKRVDTDEGWVYTREDCGAKIRKRDADWLIDWGEGLNEADRYETYRSLRDAKAYVDEVMNHCDWGCCPFD